MDDGGKFTWSENGTNRGAKATVLWAPYMHPHKNFEDILDNWHTRQAVPFAVRAGCLPHCLGTELYTCNHAELAALNCDLDMLMHDDPCIHILDSNATAFTARSIRDNPNTSMRRRVRGAGIAAGKGDIERLRNTMDIWTASEPNKSRAPWNERQFVHSRHVCEQMNAWKIKQWPANYRDTSLHHPIYLVDSHQLNSKGELSGRYEMPIPCEVLVRANDLPDRICTCILDINSGNKILPYLDNCPDVKYPLNTLRFTFSHLGKTLNGDTPPLSATRCGEKQHLHLNKDECIEC